MTTLAGNRQFKSGMSDSLPIVLGYIFIAITFGLMAKSMEISLFNTVLMSTFIYAGSSQFMILSLLSIGVEEVEIIFTTFLINFRFFLIGTSFLNTFEDKLGRIKFFIGQTLTDETFTVASFRKEKLTTSYMIGINGAAYASWIIGTIIGFLFGDIVPYIVSDSMGIALYALFISILVPQAKKSKLILSVIIITIIINILLLHTKILPSGVSIILAIIVPAVIGAVIKNIKRRRE